LPKTGKYYCSNAHHKYLGEPSEDKNNVLISDQSNMEVRQNKPPQTSHNHDGFSLWTGSGYDDSGGHRFLIQQCLLPLKKLVEY
jgi:hypothetical protein